MFKIAPKSETFTSGVVFHEYDQAGRRVRHVIDMTFKRLTRTQHLEALDAIQFPKDDEGNFIKVGSDESLDINARQFVEFVTDWKIQGADGNPFPFTHDNIRFMLDNYPGLMNAVINTASTGFIGEARKN